MTVLFAQRPTGQSRGSQLLARLYDRARQHDIKTVLLPSPLTIDDDVANYIQSQRIEGQTVLFSGFVPDWEQYQRLQLLLQTEGNTMINDTEASRTISEISLWYPLIPALTADTWFYQGGTLQSAHQSISELAFPAFFKGNVKSNKEQGLQGVQVTSSDHLQQLVQAHNQLTVRSWLPTRHRYDPVTRFPISREYRIVLLDGRVISNGFYWPGQDPFGDLGDPESKQARSLAMQASKLLPGRLHCVDVVQLQDCSWKVVEVGDPQHSGFAHTHDFQLWPILNSLT